MSLQYLRSLSLVIGDDAGNTIDLSQLHVTFQVTSATVPTMKWGEMRIWNLAEQTANQVIEEFTKVTLSAGYGGNNQRIFSGEICRVETGREDSVDSYCDLFCQDGDSAVNKGVTIGTIDAPWNDEDLFKRLMADLTPYGITVGYKPALRTVVNPSAKVMQGNTRHYMDNLAEDNDCDWFIENGKVNFVPRTGFIPNATTPVVSSKTGMIGTAKLTINGINVRTLLNPAILTGCAFKLDNSSVSSVHQREIRQGESLSPFPTKSRDGLYKAHCVQHSGDTRENEWYTDLVAVTIDTTGQDAVPMQGSTLVDVPGGD